eukprot:3368466-Rhodomonas_salina.1
MSQFRSSSPCADPPCCGSAIPLCCFVHVLLLSFLRSSIGVRDSGRGSGRQAGRERTPCQNTPEKQTFEMNLCLLLLCSKSQTERLRCGEFLQFVLCSDNCPRSGCYFLRSISLCVESLRLLDPVGFTPLSSITRISLPLPLAPTNTVSLQAMAALSHPVRRRMKEGRSEVAFTEKWQE